MKAFDADQFVLPLPAGHRFPMEKYRRLRNRIDASGIAIERLTPPAATDAQLMVVHDAGYIDRVNRGMLSPVEIRRIGFPWSVEMVERSRRSTGATVAATLAALEDGVACNLAGGTHHAGIDRGQGYCVFNDAAVAIADLLNSGRIESAVVIDTDVHQGNGTAEIFANIEQVETFSIHGEKNFPARKYASDVDIALPPGTTDAAYLSALESGLRRLVDHRSPDLAVFTSGADPFVDDTLGSLALSKRGLRQRDELVLGFCLDHQIPVAVTMAGGYAAELDDIVDIHFATLTAAVEFGSQWVQRHRLTATR